MNTSFWKNKRVFLTGHTGFKGSWTSLMLQRLGAHVTGYALEPPTQPSLFEIADVAEGMDSVIGDVRDLTGLVTAMGKANPDIVIHMAAQPLVRASYVDPVDTYAVNVMGTVNLLEAARHAPNVQVLLNITSDKCYENREWTWGYRENDRLSGLDPYSNSKSCSELVTAAYRQSFFNDRTATGTARAGNVIGGGDWATDRIVPDTIRAFIAGVPVRVRNPGALRPWQHVLEPLSGYLQLCEALWHKPDRFSEAWNFGPSEQDTQPVSSLLDAIAKRWGHDARWEHDSNHHPHEAQHLKLDCSKATSILGWRPKWPLEHAVATTVAWYRSYYEGGMDMRQLTVEQIDQHDKTD